MAAEWFWAIVLGAMAPAMIVSIAMQAFVLWNFIFAVTLAHTLVLGLPIALLYRARRWQSPGLAVATGFMIGAAPIGILASMDGFHNPAGWLGLVRVLGIYGGLGASGALAFWLTLHWTGALKDAPTSSE